MISFSPLPLPPVQSVLRALVSRSPSAQEVAGAFADPGQTSYVLGRSSWSLRAIADWYRQSSEPGTMRSIWVPDYFCNEALEGVRSVGLRVVFYSIDAALNPDWTSCHQRASDDPPGLFVLVHYFGRPADTETAWEFCQQHASLLIEDCAHALTPAGRIGSTGDFVFFSPHKLLAVPPVGILLCRWSHVERRRSKLVLLPGAQRRFDEAIERLPKTYENVAMWAVKRWLSWMVRTAMGGTPRRNSVVSASGGDPSIGPARAAPAGLWLLAQEIRRLEALGWMRVATAAAIKIAVGAVPSNPELPLGTFPMNVRLCFRNEETANAEWRMLSEKGWAPSGWFDLAPEVSGDASRHQTAISLSRTTIFLGVHQSISLKSVTRRAALETERRDPFPVALDQVSDAEADEALLGARQSFLTQSTVYLHALAAQQRGRVVRYVVTHAGRPLAVVGAIERSLVGCGVRRVNRGPTWLADDLDPEQRCAVVTAIGSILSNRRMMLLLAPNIAASDDALSALARGRNRRRMAAPYRSIALSLAASDAELMSRLERKWRNQLKASMDRVQDTEITTDPRAQHWIVAQCDEFASSRGVRSPDRNLLHRLTDRAGRDAVVIRSRVNGEWASGALLVRHGLVATYVLGWNSIDGRRHYAGNSALWRGLLHMRDLGCMMADLGGINPSSAAGIAAFKRGLGGDEFALVGEYARGVLFE